MGDDPLNTGHDKYGVSEAETARKPTLDRAEARSLCKWPYFYA